MSQKEHLKTLVFNLTRRLHILEERKALYGLEAPPTILLEIEDVKSQIAEQQAELARLQDEEKQTLAAYLKAEIPPISPGASSDETTDENIIQILEAERQRLATLLQNNLLKTLRQLLEQANTFEQSLGSNPAARDAIGMLITLARQHYTQIEDLLKNLHPTLLEKLGLTLALENLAEQYMRIQGGRPLTLTFDPLPERLPPLIEIALFRAAQEAIEMAIQQAQRSYVTIDLNRQDEHLIFTVVISNLPDHPVEPVLPTTRLYLEQLGGSIKTGLNQSGEFETVIIIGPSPTL